MFMPIEMRSLDFSKLPADSLQGNYVCGFNLTIREKSWAKHGDVLGLGLKTRYSFIRMRYC